MASVSIVQLTPDVAAFAGTINFVPPYEDNIIHGNDTIEMLILTLPSSSQKKEEQYAELNILKSIIGSH
jgi:hypothetical protein